MHPGGLLRQTAEVPMPDPATIEAPAQPPGSQVPTTAALLAVAEAALRDLHPGASDLPPVLLSSVLDQDLGFDSLSRMELLLRTERAFDAYRAYYEYFRASEKYPATLRYRMRLNNAGEFVLPPTRVEAMYAPENFGELPNAAWVVAQ